MLIIDRVIKTEMAPVEVPLSPQSLSDAAILDVRSSVISVSSLATKFSPLGRGLLVELVILFRTL